ncbi:MAG TPA: transketolase C-terminal domain-containing protein [Bdellovibrionota bacterium]|nr:transketolase C-terminal domain-containing protein [Bdellovibrionota bacterium]
MGGKATRQAFGESLAKLGEQHPEIVVLDADLAKSTKSELFAKKFPNRFFEMGIAEANMIGTAAGLAFAGKIPFACSFGCFLTGRYDTIRLSVAYSQARVRLVGTHAGVGIGDDGHSQMGLEDVALMRALPTMGVFQPMDARETELVMDFLVKEWKGPAYLRLTRQNLPDLFPAGATFKAGKLMEIAKVGSGSRKIAMIGTGAGTAEALEAAKIVSQQQSGLTVSVWNCHSLKPFDDETVLAIARDCERIATVEDHSVIGGLGTCVAEALAKAGSPTRLMKFGVQDQFGESGEPVELYEKHGISGKAIASRISG